jgi:hypothetical protein
MSSLALHVEYHRSLRIQNCYNDGISQVVERKGSESEHIHGVKKPKREDSLVH